MNVAVLVQLSVMMFLQFFVWGAWYVTAPRYLGTIGFEGPDFGWTYSVGPIAGILSPFFVGMIADRFFATERILGVLHLVGAGVMLAATQMMTGGSASPNAINALFLVYMLCYFPTLSLTNTLAMHNIRDSEKEFPVIRVFGTIGWIAAGLSLQALGWGDSVRMFHLAAGAQALLGLFSFVLPHTPPPAKGQKVTAREILGLDAFALLKKPAYLTFVVASFLICIPLAFYYQLAERALTPGGVKATAATMTFGQMSEIVFMLLMPLFFKRLGVKWMLVVGMLAWVVRYGLFAAGTTDAVAWMMIGGVVLHGICYDFFFVTGQIYTDKSATPAIRGQAQGLLVLFTLGLGMLIGAQVAGRVEARFTPEMTEALKADEAQAKDLSKEKGELTERLAKGPETDRAATLRRIEEVDQGIFERNQRILGRMDWRTIWLIPCAMSAVVLVGFALVFRDDSVRGGVTEGDVAKAAAAEEGP